MPRQLVGRNGVGCASSGFGATERVVIVHVGPAGPVQVARHHRAEPGSSAIDDGPVPPAPDGPLYRRPLPGTAARTAVLALAEGAVLWLKEAAAQGTSRILAKMDHAVSIATSPGAARVNWMLRHAAVHQRFAKVISCPSWPRAWTPPPPRLPQLVGQGGAAVVVQRPGKGHRGQNVDLGRSSPSSPGRRRRRPSP